MASGGRERGYGPYTKMIHAGYHPDPRSPSVSPPIYQTSTFAFPSTQEGADRFLGNDPGYIYTRLGNPTIRALEDRVAALEGGVGGLATASGMAATCTLYFALMKSGDHVVGTDAIYGPSRLVVERDWSRFGVESTFVDTSDLDRIRKALRPRTRMLFIETPANPTLKLADIAGCAAIAREHGLVLVVDNTFLSPHLQNPLALGADVALHSMTKFLNGHGDVVAGMLVFREAALLEKVRPALQYLGGTMDPHQAWLVLRGIKTLAVRMEKCQANALKLAMFLESHPKVRWVNYPGLESHLQHDLVKRQMDGFGAMICFGLKGGFEACKKMINSVKVCTLAVSLGGVESLIQHPASMTHSTVPKPEREEGGITDDLIRFSVGCEGFQDLRDDLEQALAQA
jgi:methionine-gamma-lyase